MKKNLRQKKLRSNIALIRHLISGVLCLAAISLICARASAQNLFAVDVDPNGGFHGSIDEFTPNGVRSTFASGLNSPAGLAFDMSGNLFVADGVSGAVYKFSPAGVRTTFALGLSGPVGLAFDGAGNLFVANAGTNSILKFTPEGVRTTFALGLSGPAGLAFDSAGNLFVTAYGGDNTGVVYKFTPTGVQTTFASGLYSPFALAFDSRGHLFVADGGFDYDGVFGAAVYRFNTSGRRSTVASQHDIRHRHNRTIIGRPRHGHRHRRPPVIPTGLAIDSADNLFVADLVSGNILKFTPGGVRTTFAAGSVGAMAFQPNTDCAGCWDY